MTILYVDKLDGIYAICGSADEEELRRFALPIEDVPAGVKENDCLVIDDEGNISIDEERTKAYLAAGGRRKRKHK